MGADINIKKKIYATVIRPHFNCGVELWGKSTYYIILIEAKQNKMLQTASAYFLEIFKNNVN